MRVFLAVALATGLLGLACGETPTRPSPPEFEPVHPTIVDEFPAWSPDGEWVAYHRTEPSTDGPRGLYLLRLATRELKYLADGDGYWPRDLRFAPDSKSILGNWVGDLLTCDLASGELVRVPVSTTVAQQGDWSPDGRFIVYVRGNYLPYSLWVYDFITRSEGPITETSGHLYAGRPTWSKDDSLIAFPTLDGIEVIPPTGGTKRLLAASPAGTYQDLPRWMPDGVTLLFNRITQETGQVEHFTVRRDGTDLKKFPGKIGTSTAISPDGTRAVVQDVNPSDTTHVVLFLRELSDPDGHSRQQLTFFTPADTSSHSWKNWKRSALENRFADHR